MRKLLYLVFAFVLIVGMVPAAVMAGTTMLTNGTNPAAWNVIGAMHNFTIPVAAAEEWNFIMKDGLTDFELVAGGLSGDNYAVVQAEGVGALAVSATDGVNVYQGEKKWGELWRTTLTASGTTKLTWSEYGKTWSGNANITETVIGAFMMNYGSPGQGLIEHVAGGAKVHWYLFDGSLDIAALNLNRLDDGALLKAQLDALLAMGWGADNVVFAGDGCYTSTVSGPLGTTTVQIVADAPDAVRIICLADYPTPQGIQHKVRPEFTGWSFWAEEQEKVPQVRWAGEKIVLEKYWGAEFDNDQWWVHYELEAGSPGVLEAVDLLTGLENGPTGGWNMVNDATSVWTQIVNGTSKAILTSEKPGECDVTCSLYESTVESEPSLMLFNQHGFVVFFLKLESITLTKVPGERSGHDEGLWVPGNPVIAEPGAGAQFDADLIDKVANVSADELLRARVQGWFVGDDLSIRDSSYADVDASGDLSMYDYLLPAGRWVLPDDWQYLAGPQWNEFRKHWDIMNNPSIPDIVTFDDSFNGAAPTADVMTCPVGPYGYYSAAAKKWVGVAGSIDGNTPWNLVIGPFSSLDDYTPGPTGRPVPECSIDGYVRDTVVPNGQLNWFDCPMPPAKITFEVTSGPGYFKDAWKSEIYYIITDASTIWPSVAPGTYDVVQFTNPFYAIEIPAGSEIPPTVNNGGYDWDSWDRWDPQGDGMGPYELWEIVSTPTGVMPSDGTHPTKVQVYSDNHGEAMVYLNGDWNLALVPNQKGFIDIEYNSEIGTTTVNAYADYPYLRKHPVLVSNPVTDTWTWGKDIVILVEQMKGPDNVTPDATNKRVWVLVSDRDEFAVIGETIVWQILPGAPAMIYSGQFSFKYGWMDGLAGWKDPGDKTIATTLTGSASTSFAGTTMGAYVSALFGLAVPDHAYGISYVVINGQEGSSISLKLLCDESMRANGQLGEGIIERLAVSANPAIAGTLDFSQNGEAGQDPCDPIEYLTAGWNLVSFKSSNQSIAEAMDSIAADLVSVWAFDNLTKSWRAYSPTAPDWANDLNSMNTATPYWIEVGRDLVWAY